MAAKAKTRKRSAVRRPTVTRRRSLATARSLLHRGFRWLAAIRLPEPVRRELLALVSFCLALLLFLALLGFGARMALVGALGRGLEDVFGRASVLLPFMLCWLAVEAVVNGDAGHRRRRLVGLLLFVLAVLGFLGSIGLASDSRAGGYAGEGLARALEGVTGDVGAGIVMFTIGILSIYLIAGVDFATVARITRERRAAAVHDRIAEPLLPEPATPARRRERADASDEGGESQTRPVINLPQREEPTGITVEPKRRRKLSDSSLLEPPVPPTNAPAALPDVIKLALYDGGVPDSHELEAKAGLIQETLGNFKIDASVREIFPGPAVTLFALEPGPGVKVRRITELQNDLALALAARSIRIEAPVPGMARVGIEIPNSTIHTVGLRETIESVEFQTTKAKLPLGFGRDVNGSYVVADLARMPHLLIAGSTGSGKSVCINGIIATFLLTRRPEELQMVLIDPKMVEMTGFNGVPHLRCPVVTEMNKVVGTLRLVLKEMEDRYQRFSSLGVRNIDGYNLRREDDPSLEQLPYLVVIIDELADLMMTTPEEVETLLVRLAQMARATGIHLLIATQRPSVDVLTGLIKANVPARIAFAVTSQTDSRVILDLPGAERLLGRGDMLFLPPDAAKPVRIQGSFIDDKDLQYIVRHWRRVAPEHQYDADWINLPTEDEDGGEGGDDPLMEQAIRIVRQQGTASASMLQRRLRIGYNRAARLIEQMEEEGIVGPADGSRSRPVYLADEE